MVDGHAGDHGVVLRPDCESAAGQGIRVLPGEDSLVAHPEPDGRAYLLGAYVDPLVVGIAVDAVRGFAGHDLPVAREGRAGASLAAPDHEAVAALDILSVPAEQDVEGSADLAGSLVAMIDCARPHMEIEGVVPGELALVPERGDAPAFAREPGPLGGARPTDRQFPGATAYPPVGGGMVEVVVQNIACMQAQPGDTRQEACCLEPKLRAGTEVPRGRTRQHLAAIDPGGQLGADPPQAEYRIGTGHDRSASHGGPLAGELHLVVPAGSACGRRRWAQDEPMAAVGWALGRH